MSIRLDGARKKINGGNCVCNAVFRMAIRVLDGCITQVVGGKDGERFARNSNRDKKATIATRKSRGVCGGGQLLGRLVEPAVTM